MVIQFDTLRVCLSTFCLTFLGIRTRFDRNSWKSESANRKENNSEGEFSFLNVMLYKVEQQNCRCGTSSGWKFVFAPPALPWWVLGFHQGSPAAPGPGRAFIATCMDWERLVPACIYHDPSLYLFHSSSTEGKCWILMKRMIINTTVRLPNNSLEKCC